MTAVALVGVTASGKSEVALDLARRRGDCEIVSVDSMCVYRGMDIGTSKPGPEARAAVPHHLLDLVDPDEDFSLTQFQRAARSALEDIRRRGNHALLVGGTGLYVQAVIDPLTIPPEDRAVRDALLARTATPEGLAAAYAELQRVDPAAAARIEPGNARRVARALEVLQITGRPFSSFGAGLQEFGAPVFPVRIAGVWLPRAVLNDRIERRFALMRGAGLVDEVRGLEARGALSRTARQAIGYREVLAHLDGEIPVLDDAFAAAVVRTRQFARRQRMWFRRDPRARWFGAPGNPCSILPALLASWSA